MGMKFVIGKTGNCWRGKKTAGQLRKKEEKN